MDQTSFPSIGRPRKPRPVVQNVHMSRRARRAFGGTGAVMKTVPNLHAEACKTASTVWESCRNHQLVVWVDNWYRRRFGTDPLQSDQSLNISALAVLHIPEVPQFGGQLTLADVVSGVDAAASALVASYARVHAGVNLVTTTDLQPDFVRVPLDVHRTGMRSLQWRPYLLTEFSVSSQGDLLHILDELAVLQRHSRRPLPMLVDMDIHYRVCKLMYGQSLSDYDYTRSLSMTPVLYGVCTAVNIPRLPCHTQKLLSPLIKPFPVLFAYR